MTEHASAEFKRVLTEAGYSLEQIADMSAIATAREVRALKQEGVTGATSASEGGTVVGATPGGRDVEQITAEMEAERKKPNTAESFARRKKLRAELDNAIGDVTIQITR